MIQKDMTIKDIQDLIFGDEDRVLELKKSTGELKDGMKSACAFLNTDGGWVIFGITPTSLKIVGQQVTDNTRKEIGQEIAKLYPAIDLKPIYVPVPDKDDFYVIAIHLNAWPRGTAPYTYEIVHITDWKASPRSCQEKCSRKESVKANLICMHGKDNKRMV